MSTNYLLIIALIIIFITVLNRRKVTIIRKIIKNRKWGGHNEMRELAQRFIDKDCIVFSFGGNAFEGVIKEVTDGAILVEKNGAVEAINLEFVVRIKEHPRKKNGKKKSVVLG